MTRLLLLGAPLALLLSACVNAPHKPAAGNGPTTVPAAVVAAPNDNLNAVAWTQTALEHDLIFREVFRVAGEKLTLALKDKRWDALSRSDRKHAPRGLKPAIIVDVDETVLDNSPYQARLVRDGGEFNEATWAAWCREMRAKPLPGALEFTQLAAKRGITVFYLSNRAQDLNGATLENLRGDGFPVAIGKDVFLGLGTVVKDCEQNGSDKGCRRQLIGKKYRVLMQLGDQIGDFVDVIANTPEGRRVAIAGYERWIGQRWFVLPNPTYGSWEPALFNNDWTQPAAERRGAKMRALRQ